MASLNDESVRPLADKTAIGLSLLCAIHCLALPVLIIAAPSIGSLAIADDSFHLWMAIFVVPISTYALWAGSRNHRRLSVLGTGVVGMALLVTAVFAGHDLLGETGERIMTLLGTSLIALSHFQNFQLCRRTVCEKSVE